MANSRLTKRVVDAAEPNGSGDRFLWDSELNGFGLRISSRGVKSYVLQYRLKGMPARRTTIGRHGSPWTTELARREAEKRLLKVRQGIDPVDETKQAMAELARQRRQAKVLAFDVYADLFVDLYLKENWKGTWKTGQGMLNAIKPRFKGKSLDKIKRLDIAELVESYADRPGARKLAHSILRKMFNWAVDRGDLELSPIARMKAPRAVPARRRVLSPDEIGLVWHASHYLGDIFGPFVRLLMLTLQRRDEVASLDWSEIDLDTAMWDLPAERVKNDNPHRVPLNDLALAEFKTLRPQRRGLVFTTTGTTGVSGFNKAKRRLDSLMLMMARQAAAAQGQPLDEVAVKPWRLHDLRRTGTTNLQALGIPVEVTEAVLNHISGTRGGIAGVYNLYRYDPEKRDALDAWSIKMKELADRSPYKSVILDLAVIEPVSVEPSGLETVIGSGQAINNRHSRSSDTDCRPEALSCADSKPDRVDDPLDCLW